jgi:putative glycerol-1-phosphate prenyltransferase
MSVYQSLKAIYENQSAGYWVLIDPDKLSITDIPLFVQRLNDAAVDAILIGGSLISNSDFEQFVMEVKDHAGRMPVIIFPGSIYQVSPKADALLFLSLISGREAQHLIGSQVLAAPLVHRCGIEAIATAYMLIDSGRQTAAQFMSATLPLPRNKPEIAVAHALAAQYLGFKLIYLEGGSGAEYAVPDEMITAISKAVDIPLIVGGGILSPQDAAAKVAAGASFIVTGNVLEYSDQENLMNQFASAVHGK